MFKSPKSKDIMLVAKGFGAFEAGKRVGRGIVGAIPSKDESQDLLIQGGVAVASLVAAAAYTGKNKELVVPGFIGLAAEQIGKIIDHQAAKVITRKPNPGMAEQFMYDSLGLNCPHAGMGYPDYPMLASPTIQAIEWDEVFDGEDSPTVITDFAGA